MTKFMDQLHKVQSSQPGIAKRHDDWDSLTAISTIGRSSLETIANYRLIKAATRADASPQARLLLVHLIGYLPVDKTDDPQTRFVVFPGNERLADELTYSKRSIQRLADQLEEKGLLRRCYNGVNRRTGFDLTPLAMQHEAIDAKIVAVQTRRRIDRERQQMELSLSADRIARPSLPSNLSSKDAGSVTHNRSTNQDSAASDHPQGSSTSKVGIVLASIGSDVLSRLFSDQNGDKDRTDACDALKEAQILKRLTGSGRAAHIGWTQAKRAFGFDGALALVAIADQDPRRRASTDRYFGWLLRMALAGDGHAIIEQAATRIASTGAVDGMRHLAESPGSRSLKSGETKISSTNIVTKLASAGKAAPANTPTLINAGEGEELAMQAWRVAIREEMGQPAYDSWMSKVQLHRHGNVLTIRAQHAFVARHIDEHHGRAILFAIQTAANDQDLKVRYEVS